MEIILDLILGLGAFGAATYCFVLSKRLKNLANLDEGVGAAIARLAMQVDQLTHALNAAQSSAQGAGALASERTERAEDVAQRLELLLASMHDLNLPSDTPPRSTT